MNESKWNSLPPADQAAIAKVSGEALSRRMKAMDDANRGAIKALQEQGVKFVDLPAGFVADLAKAFAPVEKEWAAEVAKRGVDGTAAAAFYRAEQKRAEAK
jgi:TRAP-type C4-dicarboxylate transport system substrate-binding protein